VADQIRLAGGMLPSLGGYVAINKVLWAGRAAACAASVDYGFFSERGA
jgi:hypothetical protein